MVVQSETPSREYSMFTFWLTFILVHSMNRSVPLVQNVPPTGWITVILAGAEIISNNSLSK